jgi:hypothetical protein
MGLTLNLALTNSANRAVINSAIASTSQLGEGVSCFTKAEAPALPLPSPGLLLPSFSNGDRMLAPTSPPPVLTSSQSRPPQESLLLGLAVIGMMIVGAVFLYFVTVGLLWLEGYFG